MPKPEAEQARPIAGRWAAGIVLVALLALAGCALAGRSPGFPLPSTLASTAASRGRDLPEPPGGAHDPILEPADNPTTPAKVHLGFRLFFDPRLGGNGRMSCATCHQPGNAFSNAQAVAIGVQGKAGKRNVPSIYGAGSSPFQFWDGRAQSLEAQALGPITNPVEMNSRIPDVLAYLNQDASYSADFKAAFGSRATSRSLARALAAFERAVVVGDSPFDRWKAGDTSAVDDSVRRGEMVFTMKANCAKCHKGPDFTDHAFHTLGVGLDHEDPDVGRYAVTKQESDFSRFKTPSLRNVALSAPYMHDGSLATLEAVVDFYNGGGHQNPHVPREIEPLRLTDQDKADLLAFMRALTGRDNVADLAHLRP